MSLGHETEFPFDDLNEAEPRRLASEHEEDQRVIAVWRGRTQRAEAQRDALLGLVKRIRQWDALDIPDTDGAFWKREIDAAIKAVEGEQK